MKLLLAVTACHLPGDRAKVQAQRDTWVKDVEGMDVRFFLGKGGSEIVQDEVMLDCGDGYADLPEKVRLMCKWALDHGYDYIFKCDSDTYVQPQRLLKALPVGHDYCGRLRGPSGTWKSPYASGFGYWLSAKAMKHRVYDAQPDDVVEDRATATILNAAGIKCLHDPRYVVSRSKRNALSDDEGPRRGNVIVAACEYDPDEMHEIHQEWLSTNSKGTRPMMPTGTPFDGICVLVKTLMRDSMMVRCVESILKYMPGAKLVIVDDGFETREKIRYYAALRQMGHYCVWMDFDSGFGAKSNEAIRYYDRPYTLIFSDDFICDEATAEGVLKMLKVLEADERIGVASGRVDGNPYEGDIVEAPREDGLKHLMLVKPGGPWCEVDEVRYLLCDMTVNYNIVRREVFDHVRWHEEFKIGGDHLLFYQQVKAAGFLTAYVHGVNVRQQGRKSGDVLPAYDEARGRARLALPDLFRRMGWYKFTGLDGRVDTLEAVQAWCDNYREPMSLSSGQRIDRAAVRRHKKEAASRARHEKMEALRKKRPEIFTQTKKAPPR